MLAHKAEDEGIYFKVYTYPYLKMFMWANSLIKNIVKRSILKVYLFISKLKKTFRWPFQPSSSVNNKIFLYPYL